MFELLYKKVNSIIPVTEEELNSCKDLFVSKKLRKRQFLLQEGDVCKYQAFVEKGMLRSYTVDEKGTEHILQFASEGWWMADLSSYLTGEPSLFNIEASPSFNPLMSPIMHTIRTFLRASILTNQGLVLRAMGEVAAAKSLFEKALEIHESVHGENHPDVSRDVAHLGLALQELGARDAALQQFERALKIDPLQALRAN